MVNDCDMDRKAMTFEEKMAKHNERRSCNTNTVCCYCKKLCESNTGRTAKGDLARQNIMLGCCCKHLNCAYIQDCFSVTKGASIRRMMFCFQSTVVLNLFLKKLMHKLLSSAESCEW